MGSKGCHCGSHWALALVATASKTATSAQAAMRARVARFARMSAKVFMVPATGVVWGEILVVVAGLGRVSGVRTGAAVVLAIMTTFPCMKKTTHLLRRWFWSSMYV